MARSYLATAVAVSTLATVVIFHLITSFGLPQSTFLDPKYDGSGTEGIPGQIPFNAEENPTAVSEDGTKYLLGVGKADITGPVVEVNLMGYADPDQVGTGLRQRLYSRAFIFGDLDHPDNRFVYLVLDTQSGDTAVRHGILEGLKGLGPEYECYGKDTLAVTGTHSHSGPGAWLNYLLPQITSKGFNKQSYQAIVDGAILSIQRAHEGLTPGYLSADAIEIEDANINRSPYAYLANPREERARYKHDVDKVMTMLKLKRASDGKDMGILNWFPVHGTSMLGNNTLISGDNKGVAAQIFEKSMETSSSAIPGFVAGFSQSNVGDTSPNILGAYCEDGSGTQCNFQDSTCSGRNEPCHGRGPHFREKDQGATSCFEIGRRQYLGAKAMYNATNDRSNSRATSIHGPISALHTYRDLSNFTFQDPKDSSSVLVTCPAALGYSFAAGTTDGPGAFDFTQNSTGKPSASPLWAVVRNFLREPSKLQKACHSPKPILLDVGEIGSPYLWTPNIVDIQLLRIGQLIIIVSPGEATTMAGRRWKESIHHATLSSSLTSLRSSFDQPNGKREPIIVLGGPANTYTHYITTREEYAVQRYEGASTLYGPNTLDAYINLTVSFLPYLFTSSPSYRQTLDPGPSPPIYTNTSLSFITPVIVDHAPLFKKFGQVSKDVLPAYKHGETAVVKFVGANPRNNLHLEGTFAAVEKYEHGGAWKKMRDDADWDLVFRWRRTSTLFGTSEVKVSWEIGTEVERGLYRIRYFGDRKSLGGGIKAFEGISGVLRIE
ncbi:MAG: hypothetical protein Q9167_003007 [Letrouitia subvulpina]